MLNLAPGTYVFDSITLAGQATLNVSGKTTVYITGKTGSGLDLTGGGVVNPSLPSNLTIYAGPLVTSAKVALNGTAAFASRQPGRKGLGASSFPGAFAQTMGMPPGVLSARRRQRAARFSIQEARLRAVSLFSQRSAVASQCRGPRRLLRASEKQEVARLDGGRAQIDNAKEGSLLTRKSDDEIQNILPALGQFGFRGLGCRPFPQGHRKLARNSPDRLREISPSRRNEIHQWHHGHALE